MAPYGEVEDVDGECNARLEIADDFADNHATMRCQLEPSHPGRHRETYPSAESGEVTIEWEKDQREADKRREREDQEECTEQEGGEWGIWITREDGTTKWMTNGDNVTPWFGSERDAEAYCHDRARIYTHIRYEVRRKEL